MTTWHVWGDFIHTVPERIGNARRDAGMDQHALETARAAGFDVEDRARNGFEPWATVFTGEGDDEDQRFAFASSGTVQGWKRL